MTQITPSLFQLLRHLLPPLLRLLYTSHPSKPKSHSPYLFAKTLTYAYILSAPPRPFFLVCPLFCGAGRFTQMNSTPPNPYLIDSSTHYPFKMSPCHYKPLQANQPPWGIHLLPGSPPPRPDTFSSPRDQDPCLFSSLLIPTHFQPKARHTSPHP